MVTKENRRKDAREVRVKPCARLVLDDMLSAQQSRFGGRSSTGERQDAPRSNDHKVAMICMGPQNFERSVKRTQPGEKWGIEERRYLHVLIGW